MQGSDTLALLAEIFIALAGFTGIVAVLGQRSEGRWRPVEVIRFRAMLWGSLTGLMFAILPFGCYHLDFPEPVTWRAGSVLLFLTIWLTMIITIRKQRSLRATADPDFVPGVRQSAVAVAIPVSVILLLNAGGASLVPAFGAYLVGLLFLLFLLFLLLLDCMMFVLLLRFIRVEA